MSAPPLRMLSLCAGIGAMDYVWSFVLGQEIAGQVEIDPFCQMVLTRHWPDVPKRLDLKEVAADARGDNSFGAVDLVAGGIPCQPFSNAGKQRSTQDDRHLWPYAFALIQRLRPTWVLIENVTGFIHLALDLVQTDLESEDYQSWAYVLPACAVGAPHIRERVFVVAYSNRLRDSGQACTISNGQCGTTLPASIRQRTHTAANVADANVGQCKWSTQFQTGREQISGERNVWPHTNRCGEGLAHAEHRRCQWGCKHQIQSDPTMLCSSTATGSEPQPGMGRSFDGIANWLDTTRWPAPPGQSQYDWEPARTLPPQRGTYRRQRLRALGNAIVPQQIYPVLAYIVAWEEVYRVHP